MFNLANIISGQPTIKEKARLFVNALDLGITLPTTTGPPQTTMPPPPIAKTAQPPAPPTKGATKPPTAKPQPVTKPTPGATQGPTQSTSPVHFNQTRATYFTISTRAPVSTSRYTTGPSYTLSPPYGGKKRKMEHCPTEVHKICEGNTRSKLHPRNAFMY